MCDDECRDIIEDMAKALNEDARHAVKSDNDTGGTTFHSGDWCMEMLDILVDTLPQELVKEFLDLRESYQGY